MGDNSVSNIDVARDITRAVRSAERFAKGLREIQLKLDDLAQQSVEQINASATIFSANLSDSLSASDVKLALSRSQSRPNFGAPDLFGNALWSLMLELLLAEMDGEAVPVSNACISLGGPQSTAIRLLNCIEKRGLVVSQPDPSDGRRRLLRLAESVRAKLIAHLEAEHSGGAVRFRVNMRLTEMREDSAEGAQGDEVSPLRMTSFDQKAPVLDAVNNDANSVFLKVS
ncbi:hypothetical protein OMP43_08355 [Sphingomonas sp. CBMAI 2297]|uniref:hypothetical protein n=1 Tax=Sphingomonas sp. CBMAI 2297 TaxID=2991720 RepID=UPI00245409FB|nr:hypothetical protein [Sphingomonas sp. CBMAI 2297]MDH4744024.1 hypothetical protein [Sphingomonas sp. CBMAI 2297]